MPKSISRVCFYTAVSFSFLLILKLIMLVLIAYTTHPAASTLMST